MRKRGRRMRRKRRRWWWRKKKRKVFVFFPPFLVIYVNLSYGHSLGLVILYGCSKTILHIPFSQLKVWSRNLWKGATGTSLFCCFGEKLLKFACMPLLKEVRVIKVTGKLKKNEMSEILKQIPRFWRTLLYFLLEKAHQYNLIRE